MSDTATALDDPVLNEPRAPAFRRVAHLVLTPAPGRMRNSLVLVVGVVIVTAVWEVFRIPDTATACYVILFVSRSERTTTTGSAIGVMVLGSLAVLGAVVVMMAGLSEPAIRVGCMAILSFGAIFMSRAARSGMAFLAVGFIIVYGLTTADSIDLLGLQAVTASNTTSTGLPGILFMPAEEALLHTLLWLVLAIVVPGAVVVALNRAFGRDPAVLLRQGIAARLDACAACCENRPGAQARLETLALRGEPELLHLAELAQKDHGGQAEPVDANKAEVRAVTDLVLVCLAMRMQPSGGSGTPDPAPWMPSVARRLLDPSGLIGPTQGADRRELLGRAAHEALDALAAARRDRNRVRPSSARPAAGFWKEDAFSAVNVQFGLKVTLAVMVCYALNVGLDWPGIGTSVVTCFIVALGTLGESGHKMVLRLTGCLVGSGLGIGSVILLMPAMTDLTELLVVMAAVTFVAAWIACGSELISYAGWQIALAFYTVVLQGFGPVTDMESAKNRIVGIVLGNVVSYLVLSSLWPVKIEALVSANLAKALGSLATLLRGGDQGNSREDMSNAIASVRAMLRNEAFEGADAATTRASDHFALQVQALAVPVAMLSRSRDAGYAHAVADLLGRMAAWVGNPGASTPGEPPASTVEYPAPPGEEQSYALMRTELQSLERCRDELYQTRKDAEA